jgi:glycosyltransferase involved in cell wall biosynthesis
MPDSVHLVHVVRDLELASGGPSRSIPQLVLALDALQSSELSWNQSVVFLDRGQPNAQFPGASERLQVYPVKPVGSSLVALAKAVEQINAELPVSLVHVHGLWNLPAHRCIVWARTNRVPYVMSPRGMLSAWCFGHKRWKKEIGWRLYQRRDLNRAAAIHATSQDELSDIKRMKLTAPTAVVPNGSELSTLERSVQHKTTRNALCLTRLHPVKGIDMLIEAWAKLTPDNWHLTIAGPSEAGMREKLSALITQTQMEDRILLRGEASDQDKQQLFKDADLFILPSKSENFGMVIAEALSSGLPVITTTGTPWSQIVAYDCGWYIEPHLEALTKAISTATNQSPDRLHSMGTLGRKLVADRFAWPAVAPQMQSFYRSLLVP